MSWNYRIIKTRLPENEIEEYSFGIHEVYYNDSGEIQSCTVNPVDPYGTSEEELRECLRMMTEALDKPVLDFDLDIPGSNTNIIISELDEVIDTNDAQSGC